jgi:hypothetical protein
MDSEVSSEVDGIKEAPKGRKDPLWKKILCTILFLIGVPWANGLLLQGLFNIKSYQWKEPLVSCFIKHGATDWIGAFCVFAVFIWGGTFLWSGWRLPLGIICLIWGGVQSYGDFPLYFMGVSRSIWENPTSLISLSVLLIGFLLIGGEVFRVFPKHRRRMEEILFKRRFTFGFILGIMVGLILTMGAQFVRMYYLTYVCDKDYSTLFKQPKLFVEQELSGAHVLDISASPDSKAEVNYIYDKLYDVDITYERGGKIKHIVLPYGIYKGTWICPSVTDLAIKDDQAEVIYKKAHPDSVK